MAPLRTRRIIFLLPPPRWALCLVGVVQVIGSVLALAWLLNLAPGHLFSLLEIMCTGHWACSGKPVTVVITDVCFGGPFPAWSPHFDLSGTSFGAMALPGQGDQLRNAGILSILFRRTECNYPGMHIAFHVQAGSSPYYLAVLVEYEDGDGDLSGVELHQSKPSSPLWLPMQQSYGAVWRLNPGSALQAPFSFRLTTLTSGKTMIVGDVVPANWQPGETYRSLVNFNA